MLARNLMLGVVLLTLGIPSVSADVGLNWQDCYPGQLHVHVWANDACASWPRVLSAYSPTWGTLAPGFFHFVGGFDLW